MTISMHIHNLGTKLVQDLQKMTNFNSHKKLKDKNIFNLTFNIMCYNPLKR